MLKIQLKFIITIVLVLGFSISLQSLIAAWQEPTVSPPGDNTDTPINRGSVTQDKLGGLNIGGGMGVGQDLIINGRMAINTSTSSSRLKLLDNSGGPDIYIEGIGVNPEMALGNNLNYWSIYSDETNSDELRFWRGDNRMALTDSGTLKIKEICDEAGNNCIDISAGIGGGGRFKYVPLNGGTTSLSKNTTGTYTYNIADFTGSGLDTTKITGIYIYHYLKQSWDAGGTSYVRVTFPDGIYQYLSYYSQSSGFDNFGIHSNVSLIPINANQASFSIRIKEVNYTSSDVNFTIIGAQLSDGSSVGSGGASIDYNNCQLLDTGTDTNTLTNCPNNYVMTGFVAGWGHSSDYNKDHKIRCCKLQ